MQYLAEAEYRQSQVSENSNMPTAVDSASPISGKGIDFSYAEKLQRRPIKKNKDEAVPNFSGRFSPAGRKHS